MAMKLICGCVLAVALLGCLADAGYISQPPQPKPQNPYNPPKYTPQQPLQPQKPHQPQQPLQPQKPHQPQQPLQPQKPLQPTKPHQSKQPQQPTDVFHTCEVSENLKIPCGAPGISAQECSSINCCYDGRTCFYGKSVTLQCTKNAQFILVVARDATLPNLDLDTITFIGNDQSCSPVATTSAFAIYQFPVTNCGSFILEEPGIITYENRMASSFEVAIGPNGVITRDTIFELVIQCRYIGTSVEALVIEVGQVPPPLPVAAPGPLRVDLRLGNGQCFSKGCVEEEVAYNSFYGDSDYPVTKVLRDPVYVDVRILERSDPNLYLTLGRCWATCDPYPHSLPQWDLLIDGCPYRDDRYQTALLPVGQSPDVICPTHHSRFVFKMFAFVSTGARTSDPSKGGAAPAENYTPLKEKVYIHCNAAVCHPSLGNNCQPRCFRKRRDLASAIQTGREESIVVSSPEIIFTQ